MSQAVGRETVTGKRRLETEVEPTDREKRETLEEATAMAMEKEAPLKRAGKKKRGGKTKKSKEAEDQLHLLYDIALPDKEKVFPSRSAWREEMPSASGHRGWRGAGVKNWQRRKPGVNVK